MTASRGLNPRRGHRGSLAQRFWRQVDCSRGLDGCWLWTGARDPNGYGRLGVGGRGTGTLLAHRVSLKLAGVELPDELCALHSCDNPPCVNPRHLRVGTRAENNREMFAKGRGSKPPNRWALARTAAA